MCCIQDPTYSNIWQKRYAKRLETLSQKRKFNPTELVELQARIADLENDIMLLLQWETVNVVNPNKHGQLSDVCVINKQ